MANDNRQGQPQGQAQPQVQAQPESNPAIDPNKPVITADDMRRKTEELVTVTVISGKILGGYKDDAGNQRQREYGEGETLRIARGLADQLHESGYVKL